MAKQYGLNINEIPGTGKGGRVTKGDVISFMEGTVAPKAAEKVEEVAKT